MSSHSDTLDHADDEADQQAADKPQNKHWVLAKKILTWVFLIAVVVLLVLYVRTVAWGEVWKVFTGYKWTTLAMAGGLVVLSYIMYGCYDLIGRAYCGHKLVKRQVFLVSFICYAFTLTLSTWVGGIGMRYRLYSRLGLSSGTITRIFSLSIATNWLGYVLLAGGIFVSGVVDMPPNTLRLIGFGLLAFIVFYLGVCAFAKQREWTVRKQRLALPSLRMACLQLLVSSINWMAMAAIVYLFLGRQVDYLHVLGVLLLSSIAMVIVHIPAGVGVLETVFIALLANDGLSQGKIIAALLGYRTLYFIVPLLIAAVLYFALESRAKKLKVSNDRREERKQQEKHAT